MQSWDPSSFQISAESLHASKTPQMGGRAGLSSFLYDFDVCQGPADPKKERSDVGTSGEVVLILVRE